ncbi:MAG TPA: BadF/BadG/BcrA/BcrD ATPase family protein [Abditibacterium sp.]|jgi:N-acetylglucosamine kinase-like BadF-type ATPase
MEKPAENRPLRLGFDGGGTKTRAVVINDSCEILGAGESGSSNPYAVGMTPALDHIEEAARLALQNAQVSSNAIDGWGLGLGGVCSASESAAVEAALRPRIGPQPRLIVVEDVVSAWSGAFGRASSDVPRAVCIAGTGANCWGQNGSKTAGADGAGPLLGDRGSGTWIGESALRHTARVCDQISPPDEFSAAVLQFFEARDLKELIRVVYAPDFARSHLAGLVPLVLQFGESGAARLILEAAGRELAASTLAVLRQLSEGEARGEVALVGGVLAHAARVTNSFLGKLQAEAPLVQLVEARFEPAVGAAILCGD